MKIFGSVEYQEPSSRVDLPRFKITAEPHVRIKLKSVFKRISKQDHGAIFLACSPETCRDIEWFSERYPLRLDGQAEQIVRGGSKHYQKTLAELEEFTSPGFIPRKFDLSLPLRNYQATAVEIYLRKKGMLLADQVGLGKTVSAIASFCEKATLPALVVCQTHLTRQWDRDFLAKFMPLARVHTIKKGTPYHLPEADVYITTYHKLSGWADAWSKPFFKSVVFDEVQELRHSRTGKYTAAKAIRSQCEYALGLSGTPIYNYGEEMFNVMDILAPNNIGTKEEFLREWCHSFGMNYQIDDPVAFGSYLREQYLMLRRSRDDVGLELPKLQKIVQTIPCDLHVLDKIKDHATELAHLILRGSFQESGQAAREFDLKLRQATGISKAPFVAEFVRMLVEDGQPVVLGGWHRAVYDVWLDKLKDFKPVMFTGSESPAQKDHAVQEFVSGRSQVFIMSNRSGVGVDGLQKRSNTVVFGELDWSPGVHEQFIGRLNRDGVNAGVSAYFMCSEAGSDPPMAELLGLKKAQVLGILDAKEDAIIQSETGRLKAMAESYLKARV